MTEEELDKLAGPFLTLTEWRDEDLVPRVRVLVGLLGDKVDSDVVAVAFRCELDQAMRVLTEVARQIERGG